MSKETKNLRELALQYTKANTVKSRGGSGITYLSRVVNILSTEANEKAPMTKVEIVAAVSIEICGEQFADIDGGFSFENPEHLEAFADTNRKANNQVASAVSDSQNNTSMSFNPRFNEAFKLESVQGPKGKAYWVSAIIAE